MTNLAAGDTSVGSTPIWQGFNPRPRMGGSTVWGARCASCSKPSTISRPAASTWSASRSASTPLRPSASSYSTSSVRLRISRDGSSPSAPATASRWCENAVDILGARRSTPRRFRRRGNSSKSDCHPLERQNSSVLAGHPKSPLRDRFFNVFPFETRYCFATGPYRLVHNCCRDTGLSWNVVFDYDSWGSYLTIFPENRVSLSSSQ